MELKEQGQKRKTGGNLADVAPKQGILGAGGVKGGEAWAQGSQEGA